MSQIQQIKLTSGIPQATLCKALNIARASYYRHHQTAQESTSNKKSAPNNKLSKIEQQQVLDILHSERFVDSTVYQVYYALLDEKQYYCSIRTMYRLLSTQGETQDRRNQRSHRDAIKPELIACSPNEVWSWDITLLLSTQRLVYYYLYVIIDIYRVLSQLFWCCAKTSGRVYPGHTYPANA